MASRKLNHESDRKKSNVLNGKAILYPSAKESGLNPVKLNSNATDISEGTRDSKKTQNTLSGISVAQNFISQLQQLNKQMPTTNDRKTDYLFPTNGDIEQFQAQSTIKFSDLNKILNEEFKNRKPSDALVFYMFERFKRFKFSEGGHEIDRSQQMDILDFLLAMNFLARLVYEKKMRLMFELCDDDDDGCMRPAEILSMLQRTERIFAKECSKVEIDSTILLNMIADKKAEQKFQRIMSQIRQQNINKQLEQAKKDKHTKDQKNASGGFGSAADSKGAGEGIKMSSQEFDQDNLITYREFILAVKSIRYYKDEDNDAQMSSTTQVDDRKFYESLLPRTLTFHDVLTVQKREEEFRIQEEDVEEFVVFRYEMNNILRKHMNEDEKVSSVFGGRNPLSKVGGRQLKELFNQKDLPNEKRKEYQEKYLEMFRPPGIIHNQTKHFERSDLPHKEKLWFCNPSSQIYVREQKEAPAFKSKDVQLNAEQFDQKCREINHKMSLKENLHEIKINQLNFEQFYQSQLPPEAEELQTLVESFKDKDSSKDKEIEKYKKNAEDKFRKVKNLVPENKTQISTLRMEEFEDGSGQVDRRNKSIIRAMNAPSMNQQKIKDDLVLEELKVKYRILLVLVLSQGVANNLSRGSNDDKEKQEEQDDGIDEGVEIIKGGGNNRMQQRLRNRRRANDDSEQEEEDKQPQRAEDQILNDPEHKLSKKDILKLQKRQEKQRMQEAIKQQKEEREQRQLEQEAKIEEQDELRRQEEQKILEEERKKKEDEENKEKEEYNKWKDMFAVEEVGDRQEEDTQYENKLQHFIDYIQLRKVVLFEDLAAEFSMTSKDVVDRIQRLQESGRLVGITDDRGKFIHITEQECESVARYIKSRGRVNKADILMECNKAIRMQPRAEDKIKIQQEQKTLLDQVEKEFAQEEPKA